MAQHIAITLAAIAAELRVDNILNIARMIIEIL
jgi:hypothetical protein